MLRIFTFLRLCRISLSLFLPYSAINYTGKVSIFRGNTGTHKGNAVRGRAPDNDTRSDRIKPTKFAPRRKGTKKKRKQEKKEENYKKSLFEGTRTRERTDVPLVSAWATKTRSSSAYCSRFHLNDRRRTLCLYVISPVILPTCKLEWFDRTKSKRERKKRKKKRKKRRSIKNGGKKRKGGVKN